MTIGLNKAFLEDLMTLVAIAHWSYKAGSGSVCMDDPLFSFHHLLTHHASTADEAPAAKAHEVPERPPVELTTSSLAVEKT